MNFSVKMIIASIVLSSIIGCAAVQKGIKYRNLEVQTKMSATIFLDPVAPEKKTIFVQARNTSDKPGISVENELKNSLESKGYKVVSNPDKAHYLLQVNTLQVGKQREEDAWQSLNGGWGSSITAGAITGASVGILTDSYKGAVIGALVGGAASSIADSMVEVIAYTITTDLQISERSQNTIVTDTSESKLSQGTSGNKTSSFKETGNLKKYQTRIVSLAKKTNLKFEDAELSLKQGLVQSISGMF